MKIGKDGTQAVILTSSTYITEDNTEVYQNNLIYFRICVIIIRKMIISICLSYGFLTGILRIAQESIFSGLNNLTVNTIMDDECNS